MPLVRSNTAVAARVVRVATLSVAAGFDPIPFDTVLFATGGIFANANFNALTCLLPGNYLITAEGEWTNIASARKGLRVARYNSLAVLQEYSALQTTSSDINDFAPCSSTTLMKMNYGDMLQLHSYSTAITNMLPGSGSYAASMSMQQV